jgi:hypothetical protein
MLVMVKYAVASEPEPTFTTTGTADTGNATIISIGDTFNDGGTGVNAFGPRTANRNATADWTLARKAFGAVTTTEDDSLILYLCAASGTGSTAGVPSILEGPATQINSQDGTANSDACAWGYQKTAGLTASDVFAVATATTSPAGFQATLSIRPPAGGVTNRPAYIVSDACKLLNTGAGAAETTSYGNTSASAANATFTPGSLTLNGAPVIVGGTTYTLADNGINSFHSASQLIGVASTTSWGSNQTVMPIMSDLAGENLLLHVSPSVPKAIQTTTSVALSVRSGIAIGLASTAGNCKVWHVHGAGTSWGQSQYVPVVINTDNASAVIGSLGTLDTASITTVGLFSGIFTTAANWLCMSWWKLGVTVVSGGHANGPVTVPDLVAVLATGKERRSVISQGAGQILSYQMIQIGDGAVNSAYVNLSAAAFEFPRQYNKALKQVNYCSVDNKCGIVFYPGAGDYIDLRNAVFSSPSKFLWQWHAASSASATVLTSGMQVIGGGDVQLRAAVPLSGASFTDCLTIAQNACVMTSCNFSNCTITSASLADVASVTNSTFKSGGTGYAFVVTGTAATVSLTGNTFTGYAATNGVTGNEAIFVNIATGTVTLNISGGSTPSIRTAGAAVVVNNSVAVTIEASVSLVGAEIRIYDMDNTPAGSLGTELSGIETAVAATYVYGGSAGNTVWIQIMLAGYAEFGQSFLIPSSATTFTATLTTEINS